MKRIMAVNIEQGERVFEHGEIEIERVNAWEESINVDVQIVIGEADTEDFHKDLQKLVEKYAI